MKTEKIYKCVTMLLTGGKYTAKELAESLEVSERSVLRYIETLEQSGFPVTRHMGAHGGFQLADGFTVIYPVFDGAEYARLRECVVNSRLPNDIKRTLMVKLASLCKDEVVKEEDEALFIEENNGNITEYDFLETSTQAIKEKRCLEITYISRDGNRSLRIIEPHCKLYRNGSWYVYAFCRHRKEFRIFRLSRMLSVKLLDEHFDEKDYHLETDFDLRPFIRRKELAEITLIADFEAYEDIKEWVGSEKIIPCGTKYLVHTLQPDDSKLIGQLLSFGSQIEVLAPEDVREKLRQQAKEISLLYSGRV